MCHRLKARKLCKRENSFSAEFGEDAVRRPLKYVESVLKKKKNLPTTPQEGKPGVLGTAAVS